MRHCGRRGTAQDAAQFVIVQKILIMITDRVERHQKVAATRTVHHLIVLHLNDAAEVPEK